MKVKFDVKQQRFILEPSSPEDEKTLTMFKEFSDKMEKKEDYFHLDLITVEKNQLVLEVQLI